MKPEHVQFFHVPFPPSTNTYWRIARNQIYKTSTARAYQQQVALSHWNHEEPLLGSVAVELEFFYPDARRRDLDNLLKVLLDALTSARLWGDDSQIKHIEATVNPNIDQHGGRVHVRVWEL